MNLTTIVLIVFAYVATNMAIKVRLRGAQDMATRTEVQALTRALVRWVDDHRGEPLPEGLPGLIRMLESPRPGATAPYYRFASERLADGNYRDDFGRKYRYVARKDRILFYSLGLNGVDEAGEGDDLGEWVYFAKKSR